MGCDVPPGLAGRARPDRGRAALRAPGALRRVARVPSRRPTSGASADTLRFDRIRRDPTSSSATNSSRCRCSPVEEHASPSGGVADRSDALTTCRATGRTGSGWRRRGTRRAPPGRHRGSRTRRSGRCRGTTTTRAAASPIAATAAVLRTDTGIRARAAVHEDSVGTGHNPQRSARGRESRYGLVALAPPRNQDRVRAAAVGGVRLGK